MFKSEDHMTYMKWVAHNDKPTEKDPPTLQLPFKSVS